MNQIALPYFDFKSYLQKQFGTKVYKVSVDAGFTCPNRDGTVGHGGCTYCNAYGSGNGLRKTDIPGQIKKGIAFAKERYRAKKFIVYFQAFTNTYAPVEDLQRIYDQAFCDPDIVALSIGTRPDCIDDQKLQLINSYAQNYEVWVEYGLESSWDRTLKLVNRLHTYQDFCDAVEMTKTYPKIKMATHVILGLPGETKEDMITTVQRVAALGLHGIKIHSLYIEKNTGMYRYYQKNPFPLMSLDEYAQLVVKALTYLPKDMVIHRITGDPIGPELFLPRWTNRKQDVMNRIHDLLRQLNLEQGCSF